VQHGQLLKLSILAAAIASSAPSLARRTAHAEAIDAFVAAQREGAPESDSTRQRSALPPPGNQCLKRALAGETTPVNSQSMQDIMDYCGLLEIGQPQPNGAASPLPDQAIYRNQCTSCHLNY